MGVRQKYFDQPGERLLAAMIDNRLVGIGGINLDPYLNDASKGRIRHLYVHSHFRRNKIASALLNDIERHALSILPP